MGIGIIWLERDGATVMQHSFVHAPRCSEDQSDIVVVLCDAIVHRNRLGDELNSGITVSALMGQDTEAVQTVSVLRVDFESPADGALGISQPAGGVMFESQVEKPVGRQRRQPITERSGWNLPVRSPRTPVLAVHCSLPQKFQVLPAPPDRECTDVR
jgi:hypothetical protein